MQLTEYFHRITDLLKRLAVVLILFFFTRLFFFVFNFSLFSDAGFGELLKLFFVGTRFDISVIIYFNLFVILLYLLPIGKFYYNKYYQNTISYYFIIVNSFLLLVNLSDSVFFHFTQKRSTIDVLKFIFISDDALGLLPLFIIDYWYLPIMLITIIIALVFTNKIISKKPLTIKTMSLKVFALRLLTMLLLLGLSLVGARGGLQLRPLSVMHATVYTSAKLVPIVLNTPFTLMTSFGHAELKSRNYFTNGQQQNYYNVLKEAGNNGEEFNDKNIIIILLESFSKEYVGSLNNYEGYTPFLDSLMKESLVFTNAYSNGYRSMDAIPSVITSVPCLMDDPIITSVYANNKYTTLPNLLREKSYYSAFFHGGTNGTLGLDGFAKFLGFDNYYGRDEYGNDKDYDDYWGIYDEPFMQFMISQIDDFPQPFLAMEFALSSHYPYSLPDGYEDTFKEGSLRIHRVVRYTDYALQKFFEEAKTKDWFQNTIFIISADHPAQSVIPTAKENIEESGNLPDKKKLQYYKNTSGRYAIPILIYSPGDTILRGINSETFQQTDIMPTLLSIINYDKPYLAFGSDAFNINDNRAAFHYVNGLYQITSGNYCLLFNGEESTALYKINDLQHKNNLIEQETEITLNLENTLKAYLQEYSQRMIENKMVLE